MGIVWELDFYSRPILDERQKKLWEVLICESLQSVDTNPQELFRYSKFLSNSEVNSICLKDVIQEAIDQAAVPPSSIRFFRYQMQNMIVRACDELGLPARASRRTYALKQWLDQRNQSFYPSQPGYTTVPAPSVAAPPPSPQALPEALIGQQWMFVSLPASAFQELPEWEIGFGEAFPLPEQVVAADTPIPGILVFSPRALALAGWMSGLELGFIRVEPGQPSRLILETGSSDSWILANLTTPTIQAEAQAFAKAQQQAEQIHFLGVQSDPDSQSFQGFWLLKSLNLS